MILGSWRADLDVLRAASEGGAPCVPKKGWGRALPSTGRLADLDGHERCSGGLSSRSCNGSVTVREDRVAPIARGGNRNALMRASQIYEHDCGQLSGRFGGESSRWEAAGRDAALVASTEEGSAAGLGRGNGRLGREGFPDVGRVYSPPPTLVPRTRSGAEVRS